MHDCQRHIIRYNLLRDVLSVYFFFQAEDGIRDTSVTGVQTCALPISEAQTIFEQINSVYKKVDDLSEIISKIGRGALSELRIGSVPSISQVMVPRAIERVRRRYPELRIDINILKIEEAIDYLMLGKGDCVAMRYRLEHRRLDFLPLAS